MELKSLTAGPGFAIILLSYLVPSAFSFVSGYRAYSPTRASIVVSNLRRHSSKTTFLSIPVLAANFQFYDDIYAYLNHYFTSIKQMKPKRPNNHKKFNLKFATSKTNTISHISTNVGWWCLLLPSLLPVKIAIFWSSPNSSVKNNRNCHTFNNFTIR